MHPQPQGTGDRLAPPWIIFEQVQEARQTGVRWEGRTSQSSGLEKARAHSMGPGPISSPGTSSHRSPQP